MMNKKLKVLATIVALIGLIGLVGQRDYQDNIASIEYCKQMKADGVWPKGYKCG